VVVVEVDDEPERSGGARSSRVVVVGPVIGSHAAESTIRVSAIRVAARRRIYITQSWTAWIAFRIRLRRQPTIHYRRRP